MRLFVAKCNEHYFCKKCAKNYYEELIEEGGENLKLYCPIVNCKQEVDIENLQQFINPEHYNKLFHSITTLSEKNKIYFARVKSLVNKEGIHPYFQKIILTF